jgi:hypothetical protein
MIDAQIPRAWVLITPHDTNPIVGGCIGIRTGSTAGNIVARTAGNATDVTIQAGAFETIPGRFTHVRSTGTTASTLHAAT